MVARSVLRLIRDAVITALGVGGILLFFGAVAFYFSFATVEVFAKWYRWAALIAYAVAIVALALAVVCLFSARLRGSLLPKLMNDGLLGWVTPFLLAGFIFFLAVSVFSVTTFLLYEAGAAHVAIRACTSSCQLGAVQLTNDIPNFFVWHLLNSVPILDATDALNWKPPLVYSGALMGWLVIAFKAAVLAPLIQLVRVWWKLRPTSPRIRVRPWVWPRVVTEGQTFAIDWAPTALPDDSPFTFNVRVMAPGEAPHATPQVASYPTHASGGRYRVGSGTGKMRIWVERIERGSFGTPLESWKATVRVVSSGR